MNLYRTETGAPQRNEVPRELWNIWQKIAEQTRDIITPSNLLDFAALRSEVVINQKLILGGHEGMNNAINKEEFETAAYQKMIGLILDQPLLITDFLDGYIARATGTTSRLGEEVDFVGDAVKAVIKLNTRCQIGEMGWLELLAIGGPKIVNAVTSLIRTRRGETVRPTLLAKAAEWPRGAAFLACDIVEIAKTLNQLNMIRGGASLLDAQCSIETPELAAARQMRNILLAAALAIGAAASAENIYHTLPSNVM